MNSEPAIRNPESQTADSAIRNPHSAIGGGGLGSPLLVLSAAVLWSTGGIGIKSIPLFPLVIAGWRSVFALPLLLCFGALDRNGIAQIRKKETQATIICYALTLCLFVSATRMTTAANAILLQYTSPIWVILLSVPLLHEKPKRRDLVVAAGCLLGLVLFFLDRLTPQGLLGMTLAILSGTAMACLVVGLRHQGLKGRNSSALTAVFAGNVLCSLICLPWMISGFGLITARAWFILAALGTVQLGVSYVLFTAGLRHLTAVRATLLALIEPVLNPIWVAIWNGEIPQTGAIIGGGLILATLLSDSLLPRR